MTIAKRTLTYAAALCVAALAAAPARASGDEYSELLWGIRKVGAPQAWATGRGAGVVIAIVDTGVDPGHEDLKSNVVPGYDFVGSDGDPRDQHGHGTHVAGIAAAVADNGIGVAGVAPKARIMPVRVLGSDGSGTSQDVDDGVRWAVAHGARVINLSLGDDIIIENLTGGSLTDSVNYAWSHGAIAVVAAGNQQLFRTELRQAKAFIVTATTPDDQQAPYATDVGFATWGIAAPGGTTEGGTRNAIFSTFWSTSGRAYAYAEGTSMAAPHVSGAAAVLLGLGLSPQQVVDRLLETARDIGAEGEDSTFGHGRVDLAAATEGLGPASRPASGGGGSDTGPVGGPAGQASPPSSGRRSPSASADLVLGGPTATPGRNEQAASKRRGSANDRRSAVPNVVAGSVVLAAVAAGWGFARVRARAQRSG